jgi:soluble cytochrome b562
MEGMGSAFRKIRRQGNDASKNAETLKLAAQLKSQALVALALVPELAAAKTGSEREALVKGYRREMQALVGEIDRLILALEKGNNAELPAILESIASRQKQGHRDYRMEKP